MTKEYFSHDYGTRHKKKLAPLVKEKKMRGYGLFWVIVEMLHEDSTNWMDLDELTYIAIHAQTGEPVAYIKEFIHSCLHRYNVFIQDENRFSTDRVLRNIGKRLEIKEIKSRAGKASAEKKKQNSTPVEHVPTGVQHNSTKERKGKESKGKESKGDNTDAPPAPGVCNWKKFSQDEFYKEVAKFTTNYPKEMLRNFYEYWKEPSATGKMRFTLEKTWDTARRLRTWAERNNSFKNSDNGFKQGSAAPGKLGTSAAQVAVLSDLRTSILGGDPGQDNSAGFDEEHS